MMKKFMTMTVLTAMVALTGCSDDGDDDPEIITGIIVEKEIETTGSETKRSPTYARHCTGSGTKKKCRSVKTGERAVTTPQSTCYQLELNDGWEGCVEPGVWNDLDIDDVYDSSQH